MELLCVSCSRCLAVRGCGVSWPGVGGRRRVHLSALLTRKTKAKQLHEEEVAEEGASETEPLPIIPHGREGDEEAIHVQYPPTEAYTEEWREQKISLSQLPGIYLKLSKSRLTGLVVLTTLAGYTLAPAPLHLGTMLWTLTGTGLCSAAANCTNQWIEVPYDSQMARTRNRVLVRGLISPLHAALFGLSTALAGTGILYHLVNPLTASLGVANILLYTAAYTPLKRVSIVNTWVGSLVGAIPPLMGWAACTGSLGQGSLVLATILYAWQFPHFNALSWRLRGDYSRAGYQMMAVTDPALCKRVALRYSLAMFPICALAPLFGVTTWWFAVDSVPLNAWLTYLAWRFYRDSDFKSSRKLFHFSLFHLPLLCGLMFLNKKKWWHTEEPGSLQAAVDS